MKLFFTQHDCYEVLELVFQELDKRKELTKGFTNEELKQNGKCKPFNMLFFALQDAMHDLMKEVNEQYET